MAETKTNQEMSIEETLEALEMIIEKMEDRDSSLEETFAKKDTGIGGGKPGWRILTRF